MRARAVPGVPACATAILLVINPSIGIAKGPNSQTIVNGTTATFSITVTNTGDATLTRVHVTDAQAAGCARTAAQIATDRGSSTFVAGATYTYQCTKGNVTVSFTNSATATGTPPAGPDVTATDTADVLVINPSISIAKGPDSQTIVNGTTASFDITVTNTGDATLTLVHVTDAQAAGCARTAAQIAAARGSSTFIAGATYTYQCTKANVASSFTNSATATGTPPAGPDVTSTDTADVLVINPSIAIAKGPNSQTIVNGTTASFDITVTNTGDATLTG